MQPRVTGIRASCDLPSPNSNRFPTLTFRTSFGLPDFLFCHDSKIIVGPAVANIHQSTEREGITSGDVELEAEYDPFPRQLRLM